MTQAAAPILRLDVQTTTLRQLAVDRLRRAIIAGHFGGGERLVERILCAQLGVSRSVVREAIRYLEAEGLVEIQPRAGPVVARLDWPRARQIYDIRRLLEAEAAAACARRADADLGDRLNAAFARIGAAFDQADADELLEATWRFYEVIFTAAGHDIAWEIVQRLNSRISRLRVLTLSTVNRSVSGRMHMARICAAICAGDPEAARSAVDAHLRDAAEIAQRILGNSA
ncbi:MAG: GntR family transcriptional regulator [Gemmobacter sp.]